MSGLLCVFDPSGVPQDLTAYLSALRRLSHRGPDGEGTCLRPEIFLGHRLRSVGPTDTERQPLAGAGGEIVLAVDGRIANRRDLRHALAAKGHQRSPASDAELILDAYVVYGEGCFEKLRGNWALVLWDERMRRLLLSRDRLGVRPLYYSARGSRVIIASEIKSILALDDEARAPNPHRIRAYLPGGLIDDWSDTFFRNVRPVPPATTITMHRGEITHSRFWTLSPSTDARMRPDAVLRLLVETIERDIPPNVDVGLSLSGGIDSSAIAGIMSRCVSGAAGRLQTFSVKPPHTVDESFLIDATVRHTGVAHRYVPLDTLDHAREIDRVLDCHDEPVQFTGNVYQFALRRAIAAAGCRAVLVGYGADEIFGGYEFLAAPFLASLIASGRVADCVRFVRGVPAFLEPHPQRILPLIRHIGGNVTRGIRRSMRRAMGLEAGRGDLAAADLLSPSNGGDAIQPSPVDRDLSGLRSGATFFEKLLRCFRAHIPLLVRIEDRNASAHGLELCAPFLDHGVVEAALAFPFHEYMKDGLNKAILRRAAAGVLAPEVRRQRRKFYTPGNDAFVIYDRLRSEFLEILDSGSFHASGLWSKDCKSLYLRDAPRRARPGVWFRVYMLHRWYERVVRGHR